jgi:hypothetical protein
MTSPNSTRERSRFERVGLIICTQLQSIPVSTTPVAVYSFTRCRRNYPMWTYRHRVRVSAVRVREPWVIHGFRAVAMIVT